MSSEIVRLTTEQNDAKVLLAQNYATKADLANLNTAVDKRFDRLEDAVRAVPTEVVNLLKLARNE